MNCFAYKTDMYNITIGHKNSFIDVKDINADVNYSLEAPKFEINGDIVACQPLESVKVENERDMANGGREIKFSCSFEHSIGINLSLYLQCFPGSPFIRYRYELRSEDPAALTKLQGKDNIEYTGFSTDFIKSQLTEIQFSQFNPKVHSYNPNFDKKSEGELINGCDFQGPIVLMEGDNQSLLLAYEHGAECPLYVIQIGSDLVP